MHNEEVARCVTALFNRFWVIKEDEPELYYLLRKHRENLRKFLRETFDLTVVFHAKFVQLVKTPLTPRAWMGIEDFSSSLDYVLLMGAMAFTEEKDEQAPFLLSELTNDFELTVASTADLDYTNYQHRQSLVRVLNKLVEMRVIETIEGEAESFLAENEEERGDVLYRVTTMARYFLGQRPESYADFVNYSDFQAQTASREELTTSQRTFRQLMMEPVLYRTEENIPDFTYLRNQRTFVEDFWEANASPFQFELTKDAAMLVLERASEKSEVFPTRKMIDDILLEVAQALRTENFLPNEFGIVTLSSDEWKVLIEKVAEENRATWSKEYREMGTKQLVKAVSARAASWSFMEEKEDEVLIKPAFVRTTGSV